MKISLLFFLFDAAIKSGVFDINYDTVQYFQAGVGLWAILLGSYDVIQPAYKLRKEFWEKSNKGLLILGLLGVIFGTFAIGGAIENLNG